MQILNNKFNEWSIDIIHHIYVCSICMFSFSFLFFLFLKKNEQSYHERRQSSSYLLTQHHRTYNMSFPFHPFNYYRILKVCGQDYPIISFSTLHIFITYVCNKTRLNIEYIVIPHELSVLRANMHVVVYVQPVISY